MRPAQKPRNLRKGPSFAQLALDVLRAGPLTDGGAYEVV